MPAQNIPGDNLARNVSVFPLEDFHRYFAIAKFQFVRDHVTVTSVQDRVLLLVHENRNLDAILLNVLAKFPHLFGLKHWKQACDLVYFHYSHLLSFRFVVEPPL